MEFLSNFSEAGIPVIIASPPGNEFTTRYRHEVFQNAGALVFQKGPVSGVSLHRQSTLTPIAKFGDPMHLWPSANHAYRAWLNDEIVRVLRMRDD